MLFDQFGDEYLEEQDEVEFLVSEEEPRTLAEIVEAEQEFFDKVWYVRSLVDDDDERELSDDIRTGMMANRERVEAEYGRDALWEANRARARGSMAVRLHQRETSNAPMGPWQ